MKSIFIRLIVPVVLLAAAFFLKTVVFDDRGGGTSGGKGPAQQGSLGVPTGESGEGSSVQVEKTLWYWGFEIGLERATIHTMDGGRRLNVSATLKNQGDQAANLDNTILLTSNAKSYPLNNLPRIVPGGSTGKDMFSFEIGQDEVAFEDASLTFGNADKAQAVVRLGSDEKPQTFEPREVKLPGGPLAAGAVSMEVADAELRADHPSHRGNRFFYQAPAGRLFLHVDVAGVTTTSQSGRNIKPDTITLKLPDGSTVAAEFLNEVAYPDKPARDFRVSFQINDSPRGTYSLILRDTEAGAAASTEFTIG